MNGKVSRISLDNRLIAQQAILNRLSSDLSSALTLCLYPTSHVTSVINILLWLGRLPGYQRSLSSISSTSTPFSGLLCDVLFPFLAENPSFCKTYCPKPDLIQCLVPLGEIVNYLLFLKKGDYRRLGDRLLDIKYQVPSSTTQPQGKQRPPITHPDYYFPFEKHLLRSLTKLLHSAMPLVWRSRVYRRVSRWGTAAESGECGECHNPAVNVVWTGCGHLHCHYCLGESCGVCGAPVNQNALTYP